MMDLDSQMRQVTEEKDDVLSTFITPFQMINYTVLRNAAINSHTGYPVFTKTNGLLEL